MLTANCTGKKTVEKAETTETTEKTESVMKVASPPFKQFVVVTTEDVGLYKKADTNSPTLVRWIESECESDFCENFYQWSDQPGKSGYELSPEIIAYESRVFPVLGEEGNFYKVYTLNEWCEIESAYISKDCVGNIESTSIKTDMLEAEDNYLNCRVVKDGKYKDVVFIDEYDELNGENLQVGVLKDGVIAIPSIYNIDCQMLPELEGTSEDLDIKEDEGSFYLNYNKSLSMVAEKEYESYQLNLKKLSPEQLTKIIDTVTTKQPEYVKYMYHFPAQGLQSFYYMAK
ncbi:MAG: hypothetical protein J5529_04315 [Prevotella sp.]|nr:hypothetical protein [Prevotella sp.]